MEDLNSIFEDDSLRGPGQLGHAERQGSSLGRGDSRAPRAASQFGRDVSETIPINGAPESAPREQVQAESSSRAIGPQVPNEHEGEPESVGNVPQGNEPRPQAQATEPRAIGRPVFSRNPSVRLICDWVLGSFMNMSYEDVANECSPEGGFQGAKFVVLADGDIVHRKTVVDSALFDEYQETLHTIISVRSKDPSTTDLQSPRPPKVIAFPIKNC